MKLRRTMALLLATCLTLAGCTLPTVPEQAARTQTQTAESGLRVDFLDVGQADSALVRCGGEAMLIDGGNVGDSSYVVSYLEREGVTDLKYMVASHAHEDHAGGLSGPLNTVTVEHVYAPVQEADAKFFRDLQKYTKAQGRAIEIPKVGDTWPLGDATVTVLGPVRDYDDTNNTSLVLVVDYGETSVLFTGDMESSAEEDLIQSGADLSATVLKVGHHGSSTSSSSAFLDAVNAKYAVISVGAGNSYGHPSDQTLERLQNFGMTVYRTDELGIITCRSDGKSVSFTTESGFTPASPSPTPKAVYIGNVKTKFFHREDCGNLPNYENQIIFESRQEAIDAGYRPCGNCDP